VYVLDEVIEAILSRGRVRELVNRPEGAGRYVLPSVNWDHGLASARTPDHDMPERDDPTIANGLVFHHMVDVPVVIPAQHCALAAVGRNLHTV